jgi:ATP-dependent Lhr-like helicase
VKQTLADCLTLNMDIDGLITLLKRIESGEVQVVCRELTSPSPLAQEILGAKPFAFLDDAPAEERRTLAVQSRRYMTAEQAAELGSLDPAAIERVKSEAWPQVLNADELHDALVLLGFVTADEGAPWRDWFERLRVDGRATTVVLANGTELWASAERLPEITLALPGASPADALVALESGVAGADAALTALVQSRLEALGPVTAEALARPFGLRADDVAIPLIALERGHGDARPIRLLGDYWGDYRGAGRGRHGRVVRAATARAYPPPHAEATAQRDRARHARRLPALPVSLAGAR